ncbi:hypothetical protein SRABI98_02526 [Microbacterium sp. Bi98]|nr:hypothetical protein ASE34_03695 [Microbacterium sp. Root280D1]CAH0222408.1 hypothetical protein SRABI98_02526 [Microbacterium sp. Bi98]
MLSSAPCHGHTISALVPPRFEYRVEAREVLPPITRTHSILWEIVQSMEKRRILRLCVVARLN